MVRFANKAAGRENGALGRMGVVRIRIFVVLLREVYLIRGCTGLGVSFIVSVTKLTGLPGTFTERPRMSPP